MAYPFDFIRVPKLLHPAGQGCHVQKAFLLNILHTLRQQQLNELIDYKENEGLEEHSIGNQDTIMRNAIVM